MPRAKTIQQSVYPYNISGRCINKEWFHLPMNDVWLIFSEELYLTSVIYNLKIHSFVLMNNHFHLIASTPDANISQCMHRFMNCTSKRLTAAGNRINGTFGSRYYKTILHHPNYFLNAYKYNYINPLKAKITDCASKYQFSTLHGLLGQSQLIIPTLYDDTLFSSVSKTLKWLNTMPTQEQLYAVGYALKRPYFRTTIDQKTQKPILSIDAVI